MLAAKLFEWIYRRSIGRYQVVMEVKISEAEHAVFVDMLQAELDTLQPYNCARYRLPMNKTAEWIKQQRPR